MSNVNVLEVMARDALDATEYRASLNANSALIWREKSDAASAAIAELIEAADKYLDDSRLESRLNLIDALKTVQGQQS